MIDFDKLVLSHCVKNFGRPIKYCPQSGDPIEIYGIFDNVTRFLDPMSGMIEREAGNNGVVASRLMVGVRLSDFSAKPTMGDKIMIDERVYYVQEVAVDGQGCAHLVLNGGKKNEDSENKGEQSLQEYPVEDRGQFIKEH